ncbi:MAG: dockerin type I repeat-containing protein [Candidatus Ozemobacteraceae bacterium]
MKNNWVLVIVFCLLIGLGNGSPLWAAIRGDIDGNGKVNLTDAVFILGWINSGRSTDTAAVLVEAKALYPVSTTVNSIPAAVNADIDGNGKVNLSDVVFILGWINAGRSSDATTINTEAKLLYPVATSLVAYPGTEIGSSTISISIDGIKSN